MREIQEATIRETQAENAGIVSSTIASDINRLYVESEQSAAFAVGHSVAACKAAIKCGKLLNDAKASIKKGDFLSWLSINCPAIQERTAQRYMQVATKHPTVMSDASFDFQTLKSLYIACGIMPEPEGHEPSATKPAPVWIRWTERFDNFRDKLKPEERQSLRAWLELQLSRL